MRLATSLFYTLILFSLECPRLIGHSSIPDITHRIQRIVNRLFIDSNPDLANYSVIIDIYQKSSETIHFTASDNTGYIDRDFEPCVKKCYIMVDNSNNLDEIVLNIKGQTKTQIINLDQILDYGETPYMNVGKHFKFLSGNIVYEFHQIYTFENQLHLDDTLYFTLTFYNRGDFTRLLAEENLPKDYWNIALEVAETLQASLSTFWSIVKNDL